MIKKQLAGRQLLIGLVAVLIVVYAFWGCSDPNAPEISGVITYNRVEVMKSKAEPPLDNPRSVIWDMASSASITVGDTLNEYPTDFGQKIVSVKAILTDDRLFVRAEWIDTTYDVWPNYIQDTLTRLNDTTWVRKPSYFADSSGTVSRHDQDRFAILWDMGDNGTEQADCLTMCHATANAQGNRMYTTGGGHVDVWQWEAGTSDPLLLASDEYWGSTGRQLDAGDSLAFVNFDTTLNRPIKCGIDTTQFAFLYSDKATDYRTDIVWPIGYKMAGYILNREATGSVTDVNAYSSYVITTSSWSGRWLVVMSRKLTTGNSDDRDFSGITKDSVMATIAIMDKADRLHSGSKPIYFVFP